MEESLKSKTVKGTFWSSVERFSGQGLQFLIMIVMARKLTPGDYGLVGMLAIFIAISQSIVDSGFSQALIRKQNRTETDNSTVFYFNIVIGVVMYLILFFGAPLIARFYNQPILIPITRLLGLNVVITSLGVVQRALLIVKLDFKTQTNASLGGIIVSGIVGIGMVFLGFGVWAIVWQQLINLIINTILLWLFSHWRPAWMYSWESFKELFSFGNKMLASGLLDTIFNNLYLILIGKFFKASDLGYYTRAQQFTDFTSSNVTGILQRVSFPVLATIQDEDERLAAIYRRLLRISAYVIFPLMMGLAALARPTITFFLTKEWLFSATLIQILCFAQMWYPIHAINLNLLKVKGRSDLFLKLEVAKKIIMVIILCVTLPMGLIAMCIGLIFNSVIALVINTYYTGKLIHLGFFKQMKDLFPTLLLSMAMGGVVNLTIRVCTMTSWLAIITGIAVGVGFYLICSKLFDFPELKELLSIRNIRRQ